MHPVGCLVLLNSFNSFLNWTSLRGVRVFSVKHAMSKKSPANYLFTRIETPVDQR